MVTSTGHSRGPLFQGCSNLSRMDLEECILVTDVTLEKLAVYCSKLDRLVSMICDKCSCALYFVLKCTLCNIVMLHNVKLFSFFNTRYCPIVNVLQIWALVI